MFPVLAEHPGEEVAIDAPRIHQAGHQTLEKPRWRHGIISQPLREPRQPFADHPISISLSHRALPVHAKGVFNPAWSPCNTFANRTLALVRRLAGRRGLHVRPMARVRRPEPASAPKCAGLLAATITGMVAVVGDADSMEPFQRVGIGVTDPVGAHPDQEVVSIREDVAGPADHAMVRRVVPRAPVPLASRRRMDRDRSVAHLEVIG